MPTQINVFYTYTGEYLGNIEVEGDEIVKSEAFEAAGPNALEPLIVEIKAQGSVQKGMDFMGRYFTYTFSAGRPSRG